MTLGIRRRKTKPTNHSLSKAIMPESLNMAIREAIEELIEDCSDRFQGFSHSVDCATYEPEPGFIPFVDGGWTAIASFPGDAWTDESQVPLAAEEVLSEKIVEWEKDALENDTDLTEWMSETCFFMHINAQYYDKGNDFSDTPSEPQVLFRAAFNLDSYGRSSKAEWFFEKEISMRKLRKNPNLEIRAIKKAINEKMFKDIS